MTSFDALKDFRMDGHSAIVTGGAQNIGAEIAKILSGAGAKVMIADLQGEKAEATAKAIEAATGNTCLGMACDVTKAADRDALVSETATQFRGVSTLVNNVGWGARQNNPEAIPDDVFLESYKLNALSAYQLSMACLPHLLKATNPTITNSGSFASAIPAYDILPYATAKAALNQMMVSIAHMLAKKVRVNSILIGTVITPGYAAAGIPPAEIEALAHPDNLCARAGRPEDVANAMLFLASPASSWISGQTFHVHGGGAVVRLFGR